MHPLSQAMALFGVTLAILGIAFGIVSIDHTLRLRTDCAVLKIDAACAAIRTEYGSRW